MHKVDFHPPVTSFSLWIPEWKGWKSDWLLWLKCQLIRCKTAADQNRCVERWGNSNIPQINTWNKQKSWISIMFSILIFTIWLDVLVQLEKTTRLCDEHDLLIKIYADSDSVMAYADPGTTLCTEASDPAPVRSFEPFDGRWSQGGNGFLQDKKRKTMWKRTDKADRSESSQCALYFWSDLFAPDWKTTTSSCLFQTTNSNIKVEDGNTL